MPLLDLSSTKASTMATNLIPHANPNPLIRSPPQSSLSSALYSSPCKSLLFKAPSFGPLRSRSIRRRYVSSIGASLSAVDSPATSGSQGEKKLLLEVKDLKAVIAESKQEILKGVNLTIYEGEVS